MRNASKKRKRWPALLVLLALAAGWLYWQQNGIMTETYTITSSALPAAFEGLRVAHISDLHGKEFGQGNETLLDKVAGLKPDLIVITGDLIDQESQMEMVPALAEGLSAIAPTYYVTGNHEWAVRRVNELKELLTKNGVRVLSNEADIWEKDGATLAVAGIDDPLGPLGQKSGPQLRAEIKADFTLLLAHRDSVEEYAQWGYDVVFCGHGHGGIFRIPILDKGLLSTDRTFFPKFDGGTYPLEGDGTCVVSRGLGSNTVPFRAFRLFNRPHLPLIILTRGA